MYMDGVYADAQVAQDKYLGCTFPYAVVFLIYYYGVI